MPRASTWRAGRQRPAPGPWRPPPSEFLATTLLHCPSHAQSGYVPFEQVGGIRWQPEILLPQPYQRVDQGFELASYFGAFLGAVATELV